MTNATAGMPKDADSSLDLTDRINRIAEKMRAESGTDLPRDYFLQEARSQLSRELPHPTKDEKYWSSACFDAWAKPEMNKMG